MQLPRLSAIALLFVAASSLSVATSSRAQTLSDLPADARIRIVLDDSLRQGPILPPRQLVAGRLVRVSADSVTLRLMGSGDVSIARSAIGGAQVSRGASRVRSAVSFGLSIGLASALVVYTQGSRGRYHQSQDALVGGAVGFGVGAIGGALSPFEQWRRVRW